MALKNIFNVYAQIILHKCMTEIIVCAVCGLFFNVYLFLRESETVQAGEGQRERETERETQNPKQPVG